MSSPKLSSLFGLALFIVFGIVAASGNAADKIALPGVAAATGCATLAHEGPLGY